MINDNINDNIPGNQNDRAFSLFIIFLYEKDFNFVYANVLVNVGLLVCGALCFVFYVLKSKHNQQKQFMFAKKTFAYTKFNGRAFFLLSQSLCVPMTSRTSHADIGNVREINILMIYMCFVFCFLCALLQCVATFS